MSKRAHRRRDFSGPIDTYARRLLASGMPRREVTRAYLYAQHYGLDALSGPGCVSFGEPSCGDWNCVSPEHQLLVHDGAEP